MDEIIVAVDQAPGLRLSELLDCKLAGIRVLDLTAYFERAIGQIHIDSIQASWLIFGDGFRHGILGTVVKRVFDITGALALLVLASPVMLAIALLVMLGSGHRILHRQQRVGLGGRTFELNKFCAVRAESKCLRIADAF
ncbi:MAG: sugar transferase, partial [Burkholderiales bacterium]